jgi:homoserine kinase
MQTEAKAFAPASVSNVACGFDIMGFALESLGDTVTVRRSEVPGVRISRISGIGDSIPLDVARNTAGPPVAAMAREFGCEGGLEVEVHKGFFAGSGLGSSAASAVAATVACNELLGTGLPRRELLRFALEGEQIASGALHADNVAPSMLGGFVLIRGYDPLDVVRLDAPPGLWCAIVLPHVSISTMDSRRLLPVSVPLKDVVTQTGNAAGLVAGILTRDSSLIGRSLCDVIVEPVRAPMIEGFADIKRAALDAGALGCSISGSGPALFALADGRDAAERISLAMAAILTARKSKHDVYVSRINSEGAVPVRCP